MLRIKKVHSLLLKKWIIQCRHWQTFCNRANSEYFRLFRSLCVYYSYVTPALQRKSTRKWHTNKWARLFPRKHFINSHNFHGSQDIILLLIFQSAENVEKICLACSHIKTGGRAHLAPGLQRAGPFWWVSLERKERSTTHTHNTYTYQPCAFPATSSRLRADLLFTYLLFPVSAGSHVVCFVPYT